MPSILGFTFGFGAQDRGLKSAFGSVQENLSDISGQVSKLGGIAKNVNLGTMFAGFGMAGLSRVSEQLDKMVGGNVNLVNGLESTMIASKKAARVIGAQAGLMGKDLNKFTSSTSSLAYGMNLGIDQVAKAQKTYSGLSKDFRKGLNQSGLDLKDFLRAEEATGITSEDLMKNLNGLAGSFGFTGEEAGSFLDKFTASSLAGGLGTVAFGTMKTTLDDLKTSVQQNGDFLAKDAAAKRQYIEDQVIGTQKLAGTIYRTFGGDAGEAQSAAVAFAKKLNEEQTAISGMLAGLGGEFKDLFTSVSKEAGVGVAEAFIGKSPDEAMKVLLMLRARFMAMGKGGEDALLRLNTQFANIAPQMQVGLLTKEKAEEFKTNMAGIEDATDKAKGAFDKFGKAAYTSGLSVADGVSRAKDAFESTLGAIGGGTGQFAAEQVKGYNGAADAVKNLASNETWGPLTKRFALASRIGVSGFLLPMREEGKALTAQIKKVGEAAGQGGLAGRLKAVQQLGLAGVFLDLDESVNNTAGAMNAAQKRAADLYAKFTILKTLKDTFVPVAIALAGALGALVGVLKLFSVAQGVLTGILSPIVKLTGALFQLTLSTIALGASIIGWPATIFLVLVAFIAIWEALPQYVKDAIDSMLAQAADFVNKLTVSLMAFDGEGFANKILELLHGVAMSIKAFFSGEELAAGADASGAEKLGIALGNLMTTAWETVKDVVGTLLKGMWEDPEIKKYITIPLGVALVAGALPKIAAMINSVTDTAVGKKGVGYVKEGFGKAGGAVKEAVMGGRDAGALKALKFAKEEADVARQLVLEAAKMTATATTASAIAGAQASTVAAGALAAETTAAVATAQGAFAATSWYATALTAGTGMLTSIGTALGAAGAAATAIGGGVVLAVAAAVVAGVGAAYASPETKEAATDWMNGLNESISDWSANLKVLASGAGESFGDGISSVMGFMNLEWLDGEGFSKKVDDSFLWLMNLGGTFLESMKSIDLTGAAVELVRGMFNSESFAGASEAIDWGALASDILNGLWGAIKALGMGLAFVGEILAGVVWAIADGVTALVTVVVGGLGTLLFGVLKKALLSVATLFGEFLKLRLGEIGMVASWLPDSIGGGIVKGVAQMTQQIDGAIASVTPTSEELAARSAKAAAKAAAKVQNASAEALLEQQQLNAEQYKAYYDASIAPMLSKMGINVDELNAEQLALLHNKLNAATEQYGKEGHDFSEKGAQRLLAGVTQGFAKEMDTASGIMMGMTFDPTLSKTQIEERMGGFYEELENGVQSFMDANNIITKNLTDAERKKLIDQKIEFTELTDDQRSYFEDQMTITAKRMAESGEAFSAENKATLMKAILDGFQTQAYLDKLKKARVEIGAPVIGPLTEEQQAKVDKAAGVPAATSAFGGVGDAVGKLAGGVGAAGMAALEATAGGLKAGAPLVGDAMGTAFQQIVDYLPKKGKPKTGKGVVVNVADGGVQIMAEIARGMVEGTTMVVKAMDDAMLKVQDSLYNGILAVFNAMSIGFGEAGRAASMAFSRGVFLEQDLQFAELQEDLRLLFNREFAGTIKVVDVAGMDSVGAATLSVDSVKTLTEQIIAMKTVVVNELKLVVQHTRDTADNTDGFRGKVASITMIAGK